MSTEPRLSSNDRTEYQAVAPSKIRLSYLFKMPDGNLWEVTVLVVTRGEWAKRPESSDPAWKGAGFGPWVISVRLTASD